MRTSRWVVFVAVVLFSVGTLASTPVRAGSTPANAAEEKEAPPEEGHREGHKEEPVDPYVSVPRAQQLRTPAAAIWRGQHQSIQVNVDAGGNNIVGDAANEPTIAIDPLDASKIVIGWRQFDTVASNFRQAGYAYSHDGGATWTFPGVLEPGVFRSDPVLSVDSDGVFFYYSLTLDAEDNYLADMFMSFDDGVTWTGPVWGLGGDKTWMTIDTTGGIGNNHIYATWNRSFTCCESSTDFTRSIDGGQTYEGPYILPVRQKWGTLDVGPDGELYVAGLRGFGTSYPVPYLVLKSTSIQDPAGAPVFEQDTGIDLGGDHFSHAGPNPEGLLGQVWVAVDRSSGATSGNVYVLASVAPPDTDPLDVMFTRSEDGGLTWSAPVRVNDDSTTNGAFQWFSTMSVAPDGRIDVIWNDTRNDSLGESSEVYYAYSTDTGITWSSGLAVTPAWNSLVGHPNQAKIGDYYHMISDASGAALAYAATFNAEQDVYFLRVGDCNANGQHDAADIAIGTSTDCNANGIPDECEDGLPCQPCGTGAECDDGVACNGVEACLDGWCQAGVPVDCIDGVECTLDSCTEPLGTCVHVPFGPEGCGNGACEPSLGEDCLSCPEDCNGKQTQNPKRQFCCGDGDGTNPVGCEDGRCLAGGMTCSDTPLPPLCCGDGICDSREDSCSCAADCGSGCGGPVCDNDDVCDPGEDCEGCPSDCAGVTTGKPSGRFCCGDGVLQPPEGDGSICDGNH